MEDEVLNMELYNSVQSFFLCFYYERDFENIGDNLTLDQVFEVD